MNRDAIQTTAFTLVWVVGVFLVALPYLVVARTPERLSVESRPLRLLGLPFVAAGAALYLWSVRELTDPGGTPVPANEPEELVTDGPYRFTRNPFYVSVLSVLVGEALLAAHLGVAAYAGVVWCYFEALVVGYEEPRLRERYGEEYEAYRRRTPRWVPTPRQFADTDADADIGADAPS